MTTRQRTSIACRLSAAVLFAAATVAHAQQPAAPPVAAPKAGQPADAGAKAVESAQPALETNPAIRAALETPRKKPRDYVQAVLWLIDLGRPELAQPILADLAKLQLTDD